MPHVPKLVGQSEQAPGLKQRTHSALNKALGLDKNASIPPMHLASIAENHPDPTTRKLAASALSKLDFNMNPLKKGR